jgi:hypothetical protein
MREGFPSLEARRELRAMAGTLDELAAYIKPACGEVARHVA